MTDNRHLSKPSLARPPQQGYEATTVEQIADAAEVSSSTFFRYFPAKEDTVLTDEYDEITVASPRAQPPELSPATTLIGPESRVQPPADFRAASRGLTRMAPQKFCR